MTRIDFRTATRDVPPNIPAAVQRATTRLVASRVGASQQVPEWESLRQTAHDLRLDTLLHLDEHIAQVQRTVAAAGGHVHLARDAAEANAIVVEIARASHVHTAVKGKSMATEETGLNHALEQAGVRPVETDVGEFIIQLAGERPSHILGPTLHMSKEDIAALFARKLGIDAPPDPRRLTDIARAQLRQTFLSAEMGITGANFVVAETGTVVLLTNEGNGRLCTTLPDIHVAVAGIDKIIPDWNSLAILLRLLARSATGQKMACHTSFITGPRRAAAESGPREFHLVLLDNGRMRIRGDPALRETLLCIRCAACLNVCPVYNQVGGHPYGGVYSGPIGAILVPQLSGMQVGRDLPFASTLCGACADVCPVKVPIPNILLHLRRRVVEGDTSASATAPSTVRAAVALGQRAFALPAAYQIGSELLRLAQAPFRHGSWLPAAPPPISRWTAVRPMPAVQPEFRRWWRARSRAGEGSGPVTQDEAAPSGSPLADRAAPQFVPAPPSNVSEVDMLIDEVNRLAGHARRITPAEVDSALQDLIRAESIKSAVVSGDADGLGGLDLGRRFQSLGVEVVSPDADKQRLARTDLGITTVDYAIPESGSLAMVSAPDKPRTLSILPRVHLAIVPPGALRANLADVFTTAKSEPYFVFSTGLSRTSDIESNPVLGAHGPRALYVWIVQSQTSPSVSQMQEQANPSVPSSRLLSEPTGAAQDR